jgi:hypothetical protein
MLPGGHGGRVRLAHRDRARPRIQGTVTAIVIEFGSGTYPFLKLLLHYIALVVMNRNPLSAALHPYG